MLMAYGADCFIAIISSGIKRNSVRAIRNDGHGDSMTRLPVIANEVKQSVLAYASC